MSTKALALTLAISIAPIALFAQMPPGTSQTPPEFLRRTPQHEEKSKRPSKLYTIEQFMDTTALSGASFSHDDKQILYSSDESGVRNVYAVPVTGGRARALTTSKNDTTTAISWFPSDRRFLYTRDQGGNELNHLYVRQKDGTERDLTPGSGLKAAFEDWSDDGKSFFVTTNERDPRFFDVYRYDSSTYKRRMLFENGQGLNIQAISPDGKWIALAKTIGTANNDLLIYDVTTGETKTISEHKGMAEFDAQEFDPQSRWLYYTTTDRSEFKRLRRYDLAAGKSEEVERAAWDITESRFSRRGRYRVTMINEDASTTVRLYDTQTNTLLPLPDLGGAITYVRFSPSEKLLALYVEGDRSPADLYVYDLATRKATRLTNSRSSQVDPNDLVDAIVVRFNSFDAMKIPAITYVPHQTADGTKVPAIVLVHGGPGGQARRGYKAVTQFLVNHGYMVVDINNRGSSGYGKTFFAADDLKHGREPLLDCVAAKRWLATLPFVDANRIGIMGGSYGGYMVAAALAFQPDVFDVGVDIFGVTNWVRTLQNIPPWWTAGRASLFTEIGNPETGLERLKAVSPLFHAAKITKPLLVIQGKNDPRVVKAESDDLVAAVKANGVPVEYIVFDDEGHGFTKKKNQIAAYGSILEFLDKYLKGKTVQAAQ